MKAPSRRDLSIADRSAKIEHQLSEVHPRELSECARRGSGSPTPVFWRDSGYVFGGLIAGGVADALGYGGAITLVAALTAASGLWVVYDMPTHPPRPRTAPAYEEAPRLDAMRLAAPAPNP